MAVPRITSPGPAAPPALPWGNALAIAAILALLIAIGGVTVGGPPGPRVAAAAVLPGSASCDPNAVSECVVAPAGESWTLAPPSTWCSDTIGPPGPPTNGSNRSAGTVTFSCHPPIDFAFEFNASGPVHLRGNLTVTGPTQLWLYPPADACDLYSRLAHVPLPCPPPWPGSPSTDYNWNESFSGAGTIDLAQLSPDFGLGPGVLPVQPWLVELDGTLGLNETATALTDVTVDSA